MSEHECLYVGESNEEVQLLTIQLRAEGIEAHVVEDQQPWGVYAFGVNTGIAQPKIFVRKEDLERAHTCLTTLIAKSKHPETAVSSTAFCYHCGTACSEQDQECPTCHRSLIEECDSQVKSAAESNPGFLEGIASLGKSLARGYVYSLIFVFVCTLAIAVMSVVVGIRL